MAFRIFISAHVRDRNKFSIKIADRKYFPKKTIAPLPLQVKWMFHKAAYTT